MARNLVARDGEDQRLVVAFARNRDLDDRAFRALQHVGYVAGGQAIGGLVIDLDDHVARPNPGVIRRRADVRRHHHGVVFARSNHHAHAVIFAALVFAQQRKLAGIKEIRVRIEHPEHPGDGTLIDGLVDVHLFGVVGLHDVQHARKVADGGLIVVGRGGGGSDIWPVNAAQDCRYNEYCHYEEQPATLWFHSTLAKTGTLLSIT